MPAVASARLSPPSLQALLLLGAQFSKAMESRAFLMSSNAPATTAGLPLVVPLLLVCVGSAMAGSA